MRSSLFASVDVIEFQTMDAYSSLDLTNVIIIIIIILIIIIIIMIIIITS
jgi:hypothetical protein